MVQNVKILSKSIEVDAKIGSECKKNENTKKSSTIKEITKNWIDQLNPYEKRSRSKNFIVLGLKSSFKSTK